MTIEEAHARICGSPYCRITWNEETAEVLEACGLGESTAVVGGVHGERNGLAICWTVRETSEVTVAWPEQQAQALRDAEERRRIFDSYIDATTEELLAILERDEYPPLIHRTAGARNITRELLYVRRTELTGPLRERVRQLVKNGLPGPADAQLRRCLMVVEGDAAGLAREWREWNRLPVEEQGGFDYFDLLECLGAVRVTGWGVLEDLVRLIEEPVIYKSAVMLALGRIGEQAGERAAEAIRRFVPEDHSPEFRRRVLERLTSPEEAWEPCPRWQDRASPRDRTETIGAPLPGVRGAGRRAERLTAAQRTCR